MSGGRTGILLVQLGGPTKREELKDFLYRLFADPEILGIPFAPVRKAVAWTIATAREKESAKTYEKIGWSPIRCWTEKSALLLERALATAWPGEPPLVLAAMTCSAPLVEEVLPVLRAAGVTRLFVLPLYPQYSVTTTKGSFARVDEALARMGWSPERVNAPDAWYAEPRFLEAHAARIAAAAATLPDPDPAATVLLYSAHSLPVSTVEKRKDPYPRHVEECCALIDARLGRRFRSRLGYQSKLGPVAWLGPATGAVLAELAKEGVKQVVVCPVAFVSDHVETLYEIRMLFAEEAKALGIAHYVAADGLNDHPEFIGALADVSRKALLGEEAPR
jgi:ferrochelatase